MASLVALVQGASRGLGLQFCRHLLATRPEVKVIATCRQPDSAQDLQVLAEQHSDRLETLSLDVTREDAISSVAAQVQSRHSGLDLLINCAAMLHPSGRGETALSQVTAEGLLSTLATNTVGPLLMAKHFRPLLLKGQGTFGSRGASDKERHCAVVVNMSAKVGSITDNGLGGWYSYRMSKSALNMATKNLSIELGRGRNKVICVSLHPGTVDTDLSRPYHRNVSPDKLFTTEYSVERLMTIVDGLGVADSGKFFAWDGNELPY